MEPHSTSEAKDLLQRHLMPFSNPLEHLINEFYYKVHFEDIDAIPNVSIDSNAIPSKVKYQMGDVVYVDEMTEVELSIKEIMLRDEQHFLSLHPYRYARQIASIIKGQIEYPFIKIEDEANKPVVSDGRHRLMALNKLNFQRTKALVPVEQKETILDYFATFPEEKKNLTRRPTCVEIPQYSLQSFIL